MPIADTININGYLFKFTSNFGVGIPGEHLPHLNEPRYVEALEFALAIYPDFLDFAKAQDYESTYVPLDHNIGEKYQEFRQRMVTQFVQWNASYLQKCWERDVEHRKRVREMDGQKKVNPGYLYLLVCGNGLHKIGVSAHPKTRLSAFKNSIPFNKKDIRYEHLLKVGDMLAIESSLHKKYADKRVAGEWFNLTPEDVSYIKSLKGAEL